MDKIQKEFERFEEIESIKLKQLSDIDCNLETIKKCDGCDLWYMIYDTELHKMRWHCIKMQVADFLLRRGARAIQTIQKNKQDEQEKIKNI